MNLLPAWPCWSAQTIPTLKRMALKEASQHVILPTQATAVIISKCDWNVACISTTYSLILSNVLIRIQVCADWGHLELQGKIWSMKNCLPVIYLRLPWLMQVLLVSPPSLHSSGTRASKTIYALACSQGRECTRWQRNCWQGRNWPLMLWGVYKASPPAQ